MIFLTTKSRTKPYPETPTYQEAREPNREPWNRERLTGNRSEPNRFEPESGFASWNRTTQTQERPNGNPSPGGLGGWPRGVPKGQDPLGGPRGPRVPEALTRSGPMGTPIPGIPNGTPCPMSNPNGNPKPWDSQWEPLSQEQPQWDPSIKR